MHISSLRSSGNSAFRCKNCEQVPPSHARPNLANLTKNFRDPFCSLVGKDGAHRNGLVLNLRFVSHPYELALIGADVEVSLSVHLRLLVVLELLLPQWPWR